VLLFIVMSIENSKSPTMPPAWARCQTFTEKLQFFVPICPSHQLLSLLISASSNRISSQLCLAQTKMRCHSVLSMPNDTLNFKTEIILYIIIYFYVNTYILVCFRYILAVFSNLEQKNYLIIHLKLTFQKLQKPPKMQIIWLLLKKLIHIYFLFLTNIYLAYYCRS
jgi:hypothetical protein